MKVSERRQSSMFNEKIASAIKSIQVCSSGWAEQHREHRYGSRKPQMWWVLTSRSWIKIPINYFLIEHSRGLILFDTGIDPAITDDKNYISSTIGRFLLRRIFKFHVSAKDRLDRVLEEKGFRAEDIRKAVISHLHFDHVGGIAHIPQAELIVADKEWSILSEPHPEREWMLREHIEIPQAKWKPFKFAATSDPLFDGFEGTYDVFADGSIVLLPTPGHTSGSLSMLVRNEGWAPILLVGDLTYESESLNKNILAGTGDSETLRNSYAKVRSLKDKLPDLVIVPSHDDAAKEEISRATGATRNV